MKFKSKIWLVPFVLAVLVGVFGFWAHTQVRKSVQSKLETELKTVLSANIKSLEIWMETQQKTAAAVAGDEKLRALVTALSTNHPGPGGGGFPGGRGGFGRFNGGPPPGSSSETNRAPGGRAGGQRGGNTNSAGIMFDQRRQGGGPNDDARRLQGELRTYLTDKIRTLGYTSYILFDKDGRFMAAEREFLDEEQVPRGTKLRLDNLFDGGKAQLFPSFRTIASNDAGRTNLPVMAVTSPIRDDKGNVVAALGLMIRPESDFTDILSVARLGESGETYAFNQNGALITKSRFDDQLRSIGLLPKDTNLTSVLNVELRNPGIDLTRGGNALTNRAHQPFTFAVTNALVATNGQTGSIGVEVEGEADYRGVPVVSAWQWLPEYKIGVATQMDVSEAYRPLRMLTRLFTVLIGLLMLCALGILGFTYANGQLRRRTHQLEMEARELGQYTLERKIGEGGMGSVYLARHALLRRPTAVKLVVPELAGAGSLDMFEQEVQLTSELTHPNTIQIYDYGHTPDGIFYYAMEYLEGVTLRTLVAENGPQPEGRIIHILKQVCGSLQEAHSAGLIHRDIKPANIFLTQRSGVSDMVKVLDFGLVKRIKSSDQAEPHDRRFAGTPLYMSPESIEHPETADARADIYSLGALAYQMLTGTEVFGGATIEEMCKHHVSSIPQAPSQRLGQLCDPTLEAIILRCLAKNPEDRPQTAAQLSGELDACEMAGTWSEEMARNWWNQARQQSRASEQLPTPTPGGSPSQTLQIDLQQRV